MKTLIAIPALQQIYTATVQHLMNLRLVGDCEVKFAIGYQVDHARNLLAEYAIKNDFDRILWIDSDMTFAPDLLERLSEDLEEWDAVTGLYFKRMFPTEPVIYKKLTKEPELEPFLDYPKDAVFPVRGCGFGGILMKTDLLKDMTEPPFLPFPNISEDLSFCLRMNGRLACDSRVKLGHIGLSVYSEQLYQHPRGG